MLETELEKRMKEELRTLLAEMEAGLMPSNPALEELVRRSVLADMQREARADALPE